MNKYHKIKTLWKRQSEKPNNIIIGEYALPEFDLLKDIEWVGTEKIDGTNIRVIWDNNKIRFGGKTDNAQIPTFLYDKLNELFAGEVKEQLFEQTFDSPVCLYGEGYGAKIQRGGGNYKSDGVGFVLFDIKIGNWWLDRGSLEDIAEKLGIDIVPIIFRGTLQELSDFVSCGHKSKWGDFLAEGVVAKPIIEIKNRGDERIITKLKYKDFIIPNPTCEEVK